MFTENTYDSLSACAYTNDLFGVFVHPAQFDDKDIIDIIESLVGDAKYHILSCTKLKG